MIMTRSRIFALLAFLLPFALYFYTTAPTIYWEDSAAFQTAAHELGIVHNPSFPLYVLISRLSCLAPLASGEFMVNLVSGLFTALSSLLIFAISILVTRRFADRDTKGSEILALLFALTFSTVYAVWVQAVRAEVYALNLFLCLGAIWLLVKHHIKELDAVRFSAMIGLVFGLACANHYLLFAAALVPLLIVFAIVNRETLITLRNLATAGWFGLVGVSVYLYLPIRERFNPMFNWGDFSTVSATLKSIFRLDEALPVAVATATTPFAHRLETVISTFVSSIPLIVALLAVIGLIYLVLRKRTIFALTFMPIVVTLIVTAYAAEFSAYNLDLFGYMALAYAGTMIAAVVGSLFLIDVVSGMLPEKSSLVSKVSVSIIAIAVAVVTVMQTTDNYAPASKRYANAAGSYAAAILQRLPQHAIFLAGEDNSFSPLLCKQVVEGVRVDVAVLSAGALLRSDYRRKTQGRYPDLWYPEDWNSKGFAGHFKANLAEWIKRNSADHAISMTLCEWTSDLIPHLVPNGFGYDYGDSSRLTSGLMDSATDYYNQQSGLWKESTDITTREHFGRLLFNQAVFCIKHKLNASGLDYCRKAAATDPTNIPLLLNCLKVFVAGGTKQELTRVAEAILRLDPGNVEVAAVLSQRRSIAQRNYEHH